MFGGTRYVISVRRAANGGTAARVEMDGAALPDAGIPLVDDGGRHEVIVTAAW